ncbi:MAG: hypothetical protein AAFO03_01615 [Bacteroidota bacterium]
MSKKLLLSLASLFLIWQSYKVLLLIPRLELESWGLVIFMAWVISLFITGIFAFSGFAWPTQNLMPEAYYRIYHPKRLKRIGKAMNIEFFRKMLLATLWKSKERQKEYFDGTKEGLANLEVQSKKSEFGHLLPFVLITILSIYWLFTGLVKIGVATFLINIIGNLYPVILQRNHRMRIQVLKRRAASKG